MKDTNFDKKITGLVASLKAEIRKVNSVYLMSLLNQKLIHAIQTPSSPTKLSDGFTQKFHYIYGLIVSQRLSSKKTLRDKTKSVEQIFILAEKVFEEYIKLWITRPSLDGSEDPEKVREYGAGLAAFLESLHQPKLGSSEQFIEFTLERFEAFDKEFFIPEMGLTTQQSIDISLAIIEKVRDQYDGCIQDYAEAMEPMVNLWHQFRNNKISLEASRDIAKEDPQFRETSEKLKKNTFKFLDSFKVSPKDFIGLFPESALTAYFNKFSFFPGSINQKFQYPTDFNDIDIKLLIELEDGKYYVPEVTGLPRKLPIALQNQLCNSSLRSRYLEHRDKLTQRKTVSLLKKIFPGNSIFEEAYYGYKNPLEFEADLLISFQRTLILCEIKAKELRDPLHTEGNINKLKSDFKASIQKGYEQALRTRNYLLSQENAVFFNQKKQALCSFKKSDYDECLLMTVTAESFGALACNLSFLLNKSENDPYPLSISQFDLELLLSRLDTPEKFLDYIRQRIRLHGSVLSSDELDFAGYYLRTGNLDFSERLKESPMIFLDGDFSHIFDEDWFKAHGFKIEEKDTDPNSPYFSVIERHGNKITLGIEGLPETFETIKLSERKPVKKHIPKMKGRDRNTPCPCGSGKKYKKCCGKSDWLL